MTKHELINKIASQAEISKTAASAALDAALDGITSALRRGQKISLTGFGTFSVSRRKARVGRNPQTGESIKIPSSRVAKFSAGKDLKSVIK